MTQPLRLPDGQARMIILCDCDPDAVPYGGLPHDTRQPLKWRGVREGIPRLVEALDGIESETGRRINLTWCVRSDLQMKEIYGDAAWPYLEFRELWQGLESRGDKIAWHPHVWRWSDEHHCWCQEIRDDAWIEECLEEGYQALCRAVGRPVESCRMGWEFHNNASMRTVDRLGVRVDLSATPGHYCEGTGDRGSIFHKYTDWRGTPSRPYRPSLEDYRRPARADERALGIMEVPLWERVGWIWRGIGRVYVAAKHLARGRAKEAFFGRKETMFHIPAFTMPQMIFASSLGQARGTDLGHGPVVVAFHCDELLRSEGLRGRIYALANATRNARAVLAMGTMTTPTGFLSEAGAGCL